ncbi:MAG: thiol peroxidase [Anaerolineales bacterium]|nr:thiol peroxidase [Anaerolineales bacterium]MCS7246881.1 thiol peroxidase [Anaerolineales bacterium]MDW8160692.1 thiol peroxidase [Anaerolineales bacterium]MDW8448164.1 thiol peroxidase [Anaerolineales bacterium]
MVTERKGLLKFQEQDVTIIGEDLKVGEKAPDFSVHTVDWKPFRGLGDTQGKVRIIGSLPSLNTSVCDRETRRFNEEASALGPDVVIEMISMDLPFTLKNWCAAAGVERVLTLSDHLSAEFGERYGVLIKELRILRRAVFVVDRQGTLTYVAYMPALGDEPDYEAVLAHARAALG